MMREDLMVQQQVKSKWQHMVGVICLNQTYRKQVKEVLPKLFKRYPTSEAYLRGRLKTQENMLKPLGMRLIIMGSGSFTCVILAVCPRRVFALCDRLDLDSLLWTVIKQQELVLGRRTTIFP